MKAKLIKTEKGYHLDTGSFDGIHLACYPHDVTKQRLSIKNCQAIERGYDLDELAIGYIGEPDKKHWHPIDHNDFVAFKDGFEKAIELMGDKKFSEDDMLKSFNKGAFFGSTECGNTHYFEELIQSLQQNEWEVEIETKKVKDETKIVGAIKGVKGSGSKITTYKSVPKLDADGCLILKRI